MIRHIINTLIFVLLITSCGQISNSENSQLSYSEEIQKALSEFNESEIDPDTDSTVLSFHSNGKPKLIYLGPGEDNLKRGSLIEFYPSGIKKLDLIIGEDGLLTYGEQLEYLDQIKKYFFIDASNGDTMVTYRPQLSKYYFVDQNDEIIFKKLYDSLENPIQTNCNRLIYLIENNYPNDIRFYLVPNPNKYKVELNRDFKLKINCGGKIEIRNLEIDDKYSTVFFQPDTDLKNCTIKAITKYQDEFYLNDETLKSKQIMDSISLKL